MSHDQIRIFLSYAHVESHWRKLLMPLLKFRGASMPAKLWHDSEIVPGSPWKKEIEQELEHMDLFLCLVSYNFQASDFITDIELACAQRRHASDGVVVLPILLEPMDLENDIPFLHTQDPLPVFGRPWNSYNPRNNAFVLIRTGIRAAVEKILASRKATVDARAR